jgi:hypothetical protein
VTAPRRKAPLPSPEEDEDRVRVELDLPHERLVPSAVPVLRQIESFLREQEVEEEGSLLRRSAALLDELGDLGYSTVDHWEVDPGGWLPLPEAIHRGRIEPVGHLVRALGSPAWAYLAEARAFRVRLSSDHGRRLDADIRHVHRERQHSITLDLWGPPEPRDLHRLVGRLRRRFAPLRVRLSR